ncbi:MAG: DUF1559 domain-containing protein [Planctomycetaceae bacterium]|nr:DUF1559 domain-containing protein [Planctomycetaceae bacterium]
MSFAVLGCSGNAEKAAKTDDAESEEASKEMPGMKGLEEGSREWARAKLARNNLRMIGLATGNFLDQIDSYPFPGGARFLPDNLRGMVSWRVHLLPFADQSRLIDQFETEQPWDSNVNKPYIDQMPAIYELNEETKPGHSQFVAPAGPGFIVEGDTARSPRDVKDDLATTIVLVTVKPEHAQLWTKPGGLKIDPEKAADILGGDPNGFLAMFADGSIRTLDPKMDPAILKALLTVAGGEKIDASQLPGTDYPALDIP